MALPPLADLALVTALALVACLHGLTLGGHFPAEHRRPALSGSLGSAIIWGSTAIVLLSLGVGLRLGWQRLALAQMVIGAGAAALFTPLLLRPLPDDFVDGRRGLLVWAALALCLAALAWPRIA